LKSSGGSSANCYIWHYGTSAGYSDGILWFSPNAGSTWNDYTNFDTCFKTYGYQ